MADLCEFDKDGEEFPLVAPDHFLHRTAYRGSEDDVRVPFICQNRRSCKDPVALLDQEARREPLEISGLHGDNVRHDRSLCLKGGFSAYRNVQPFFQIDDV